MKTKTIMTVAEMQDKDKWLKNRAIGIGGSDAAIVIGLNRWKSPFQLWLEKTGQAEPDDLSENEYVYWGTVLEQAVADRFCELTKKKVRRAGTMQSVEDEWLLANVDRMVVGENAGLECKTCNGFAAKEWTDDNLPDSYYVQCQHYMMVTGCDKWYIACLIGGNHFIWKEIARNDADIKALYQAESNFWNVNVLQNIMPDIDGSESCTNALKKKFTGGQSEPLTLPNEATNLLNILDNTKDEKTQLETKITEIRNKLCSLMGNYEIAYAGERKITWKTQNGRTSLDTKKLKKELPDIYNKYAKTGNSMRILRV